MEDPLSPLDSSPSMGSAEFDAFLLVIDINVLGFKDKYFGYLYTPQVLPIEGEIPEGRGGLPLLHRLTRDALELESLGDVLLELHLGTEDDAVALHHG